MCYVRQTFKCFHPLYTVLRAAYSFQNHLSTIYENHRVSSNYFYRKIYYMLKPTLRKKTENYFTIHCLLLFFFKIVPYLKICNFMYSTIFFSIINNIHVFLSVLGDGKFFLTELLRIFLLPKWAEQGAADSGVPMSQHLQGSLHQTIADLKHP